MQTRLKVKHRDNLEVTCGAVTGEVGKPETIVARLRIDGELRIIGRSSSLKPHVARALGELLISATDRHPWPVTTGPVRQ